MFFAKHLIIERLTNIDFYYNTYKSEVWTVSEFKTDDYNSL